MRFYIALLCLLSLCACSHYAINCHVHPCSYQNSSKTIIKDRKEAKLLIDITQFNDQRDSFRPLGKHVLVDNKILSDDLYWQHTEPGQAIITNWGATENNPVQNYSIMGWYEAKAVDYCTDKHLSSHRVQFTGIITEIRPYEFDFEGMIATPTGTNNNTHYQERGKFTFSRKKHPKYWLLICDQGNNYENDYFNSIALYITHDPDEVFNTKTALQKIDHRKKSCQPLRLFESP